MNKSTFLSLIIASMAATSCGSSTSNADADAGQQGLISNFAISETFKTATASYLCEGDTTFGAGVPVYTTRSVSVQWPERFGSNDLTCLHDSLLSAVFDSRPAEIDAAIGDFLAHPAGFGDYKLSKVDSVPAGNVRELFHDVRCHTVGFCDSYIVYKIERTEYQGGAHSSYSASFLNYDVRHNNVLDFSEVLLPGNDNAILDVVKSTLCDQFYASSLQELAEKAGIFTDQIFLSHNIYLTDHSIVFYYNPYDIAPWAVGAVEVAVPWYEISQYLTPGVRSLMSK
ncbi:MAG: RsiV family protein [Bacteroidales bacterium]|nr:RsiV family protein [Bacteroidales bacterium]